MTGLARSTTCRALALVALLLAAYANHFHNGFHFDDDHTIVNCHAHAAFAPRCQRAHRGEHKAKLTREPPHECTLRRYAASRLATDSHRRRVQTDERLLKTITATVENIDSPRHSVAWSFGVTATVLATTFVNSTFAARTVSNKRVDPLVEWRSLAAQSARKVVAGTGGQNGERG